jgi:hypothetical protein
MVKIPFGAMVTARLVAVFRPDDAPRRTDGLADVPAEIEWFANLGNKATRRAYESAFAGFQAVYRHRAAGGVSDSGSISRDCLAR